MLFHLVSSKDSDIKDDNVIHFSSFLDFKTKVVKNKKGLSNANKRFNRLLERSNFDR